MTDCYFLDILDLRGNLCFYIYGLFIWYVDFLIFRFCFKNFW